MDFPWLPLAFSLTVLSLTLFVCRIINASQGLPRWNGALFFFTLCLLAMLLDFTLTMVFASASFYERSEYESFGSRIAWSERLLTYLIPCGVSLVLAWRFRRRQRLVREGGSGTRGDSVRIQTSAYTQSKLPL